MFYTFVCLFFPYINTFALSSLPTPLYIAALAMLASHFAPFTPAGSWEFPPTPRGEGRAGRLVHPALLMLIRT